MVVKNSLARRATEGTRLGPAFDGADGTLALLWGGDDIVSLTKEVVRIAGLKEFERSICGAERAARVEGQERILVGRFSRCDATQVQQMAKAAKKQKLRYFGSGDANEIRQPRLRTLSAVPVC